MEMVAILVALRWVEKTEIVKVVICSDSAAVLVSLISFHSKSRQDILYEILYSVTRITNQGGQVTFLSAGRYIGLVSIPLVLTQKFFFFFESNSVPQKRSLVKWCLWRT